MKLNIVIGIVIVFISLITLNNKFEYLKVKGNGKLVNMKIVEAPGPCSGTKGSHFIKFEYQGVIFIKRVGAGACGTYNIGESISMVSLTGSELVLFPGESLWIEFVSGVLLSLVGLYVLFYNYFRTSFKKT
jgi:hypothetical protein